LSSAGLRRWLRKKGDIVGKPEWLRAELSYRVYVRGLRFGLLGFFVTLALALIGATGIVVGWFRAVVVLLPVAVTAVSIVAGSIAWLLVPDKQRANLDQMSFLEP
jgi:hypothetical protein